MQAKKIQLNVLDSYLMEWLSLVVALPIIQCSRHLEESW